MARMTHQLAFVFGEYCEASGCHRNMTSQLGLWASTELAPLLPAIRSEFGSPSSGLAQPSVRVGDDLRAKAWINPVANGGGIYVVVVNLNPTQSSFNATIESAALEHAAWIAVEIVAGKAMRNVSVARGELKGSIDASASNVYLLLPLEDRPALERKLES